jgi:Carboxypeptidase regulatory-like domain
MNTVMKGRLSALGAAIAVMCLLCAYSFGQATSGDLVGTVTDKSGAVVAKASVEATNVATGVKSTTTTNSSGEYRINNLLPGMYQVTANAQNMAPSVVKVPIELNKTATARLTLGIGTTSTTVEVTGTAPTIDTTTPQIQTTYDIQQTQNLPTATTGLGVLNLSLLQAGVTSSGGVGAGTGPSVGGQRPRNNNFTIEGIDNNDKGVTGPVVQVPNDAVGQFTVMQNQFSPEFGHSNGGQFSQGVISGTNTFHGRAYEYFQNRNLNAMEASDKKAGNKKGRFDDNRFGGQVGGPIVKNKLFFFGDYEREPIGFVPTSSGALIVPTTTGLSTIAGIPGLAKNNVTALTQSLNGVPSRACTAGDVSGGVCPSTSSLVNGTPVELGVLQLTPPAFQNNQRLATSVDFNLSDRDQIRGRYVLNKTSTIDTGTSILALPAFFSTTPFSAHLIALTEYHNFSPRVQNEFRLGYNRENTTFSVPGITFPGLDVFPNLTINDLGLNIGPDPNAPQFAIQNLYQVVDNVSWTRGNHSLKIGGEYRKYISPQLFIQRARGDYTWSDLNSFLNDVSTVDEAGKNGLVFAERSSGSVGYNGDQYGIYGFVNDTWKVRQNLSLNLGLRYEFTSTPFGWTQQSLNSIANVPGLISFDSPRAPKKDFMPRVGFAYSPGTSGTTSIRGGFSMGYDVLYDNIGVLSRPPELGNTTVDCPPPAGTASPCPTGGFLASGGIPSVPSTGLVSLTPAEARENTASFLPGNVEYPYSMTWNFGVQHQFASKYTAEVRYVGTRGVHLNVQNRLNAQNVVTATNFLPTFLTTPDAATVAGLTTTLAQLQGESNLVPAFKNAGFDGAFVVGFQPLGGSVYHGLQTQVTRNFTNGLQFQLGYTWSHLIDDSTADFFSTLLTPRRPQTFNDFGADRSNSALDHRHRVTISAVYDLPFFKNSNAFLKNTIGNWQFTPVYTFESGGWADVQSARDANLNGDSAGDRVVFNPNGTPGTGSDVTTLKNSNGQVVGYVAINPNAQYIRAGTGAFANSSRNTLQLEPINNVDLSLTKRVSFKERYSVEFGSQFLNALNHAQYVPGSINTVNSISRTESTVLNYLTPGNTRFNNASSTFSNHPRVIQLSAKFIF